MPSRVPSPITPNTNTLATSGWSGSGTIPLSSLSGGPGNNEFSGPHYIEEQGLTITYNRVPGGDFLGNNTHITLSSVSPSATWNIYGTGLSIIVHAYYKRQKVDAVFDTSTAQQPQKFEILAFSSDSNGVTYGDIDASTMGPQGTVVTSQPWYYRRPWNDSTDTPALKTATVANFYAAASASYYPSGVLSEPQTQFMNKMDAFLVSPFYEGSFVRFSNTACGGFTPWQTMYSLPGTYSTEQESLLQIIGFLEAVGTGLADEKFYAIPAAVKVYDWGTVYLAADAGLPEYDKSRHDYT